MDKRRGTGQLWWVLLTQPTKPLLSPTPRSLTYTSMTERTLSFPVSVLGGVTEKRELYGKLYAEITATLEEADIEGVQLYPANWPRKVQITVSTKEIKERLIIEGLDICGKHIELRDEDDTITRVTLQDAPIEWSDEDVMRIMSQYGDVVRLEKEYIYHDGKRTTWTTGTRFAFFSIIHSTIPTRITVRCPKKEEKQVTLCTWYKHTSKMPTSSKCSKCGSEEHSMRECKQPKRVCYLCQDGDHLQNQCPLNDGTMRSDEVVVFLSERSVLSNFNMECPITIEGVSYRCTEQYIQAHKARLFGDEETAKIIMGEVKPTEMKRRGSRIRNYRDSVWREQCKEIVSRCVYEKFRSHEKARKTLSETGDRTIGEATSDPWWGTGCHIRDNNALDEASWTGKNKMGKILMQIREDLRGAEPLVSAIVDDSKGITLTPTGSDPDQIQHPDDSSENTDKQKTVILVGDSNMKNCEIDEVLVPVQVVKVVAGGMKVQDVADSLHSLSYLANKVSVVLIHVGTCNWGSGDTKIDDVYRNFVEVLSSICTSFPHAELAISSVPPRVKGIGMIPADTVNRDIREYNQMLSDLACNEENIFFIDNDLDLTANGKPRLELYKDRDARGVHLSQAGCMVLANNICSGLKDAYYKAALRNEWNVVLS